jgi:hypothetical protein
MVATNNDPYFRTMDLDVKPLSKDDKYRWNPCATPVLPPAKAAIYLPVLWRRFDAHWLWYRWRAPGNAPVWDP